MSGSPALQSPEHVFRPRRHAPRWLRIWSTFDEALA